MRSMVTMNGMGERNFGEMVGMMRYVETAEMIVFESANMQHNVSNERSARAMAAWRWSRRQAVRSVVPMNAMSERNFGEMVDMTRYVETAETVVFESANMQHELSNEAMMKPSAECQSAVARSRR